jgi:hypothetical protein
LLLVGAAVALITPLGGCALTLSEIKSYASVVYSTLSKLATIAEGLDARLTATLSADLTNAYGALQALLAITDPAAGGSAASRLITVLEDGLGVVAAITGLPAGAMAAVQAAEVLLAAIGGFFSAAPPPPAASPKAAVLRESVRARFQGKPVKPLYAKQAYGYLKAWLGP